MWSTASEPHSLTRWHSVGWQSIRASLALDDMISACSDDMIFCVLQACAGLPPDFQAKGKWYCKECTVLKQEGKIS